MKIRVPVKKQPIRDILIVEDEAIIGMALAADLEDMGYQVADVTCTGEDAVKIIQHKTTDLILLDIQLRGSMDGLETLRQIRQYANPRVIIISGNSEVRTYKRAQEMKVDGFIIKPINIQELQKMICAIGSS